MLSWAVETSPDRQAERAVAETARRLWGSTARSSPTAYSLNGSRPLALELLTRARRPTAVFCLSDSIAYGVYAACTELGLDNPGRRRGRRVRRPSDLAPPHAAADLDVLGRRRAAEVAKRFLLETLGADGAHPTLREVLAPALVTRGSTTPA